MSLLAGGAKETSLGIRLPSFRGVRPEEADDSLGEESMVSTGSGGDTAVDEAVVMGEREIRELFTMGNEIIAEVVIVEVAGRMGTVVTGADETAAEVETETDETAAEVVTEPGETVAEVVTGTVAEVVTGTGETVAEVVTGTETVAEVDFFIGQLQARCPVCSHRKH